MRTAPPEGVGSGGLPGLPAEQELAQVAVALGRDRRVDLALEQLVVGRSLDAPEDEWVRYVYVRDNPMGPHDEWWIHGSGCRQWFVVRRDTRTHEILGSAAPGKTPVQS